MLDSRAPPGEKYQEQEAQAEQKIEEEIRRLMAETRLWRVANSAMWVAWGIVQAHIPGMPNFEGEDKKAEGEAKGLDGEGDGASAETKAAAEEEKNEHGDVSVVEAEEKADAQANAEDTDIFKSQDEEEFDYLSYANDRVLFLWGDMIRMGLVKAEDLPEDLRQKVQIIEY